MENFQLQFTHALLGYAVQRNIDVEFLCNCSNIDYSELGKSNFRLNAEQTNSLWKNAVHLSADKQFGLHFGESMQLAALGLIGQIIATSNTVGDALTRASGMVHLITDMFSIQLISNETDFQIDLVSDEQIRKTYPYTFQQMADYLLVFVLHEMKGLLLEKLKPTKVNFNYPIVNQKEYERVLRCSVYGNQENLSIILPLSYLSIPTISANYRLQKILIGQISAFLKTSTIDHSFQTKIYHYLLTNSYLSSQSLESVAANLNASPRTIQRKLKQEGITFQEIVEKVRKDLAIHFLHSEKVQIKEIAYTLGYNGPSAFQRAFKKWTGTTPSKYRKQK